MGHREVDKIIGDMQHAPAGADGSHNFSDVYKDLSSLKSSESTAQYHQDLTELNQKMQDKGILPNVKLVDVDLQNPQTLQFEDKNGAVLTPDASHIKDDLGSLARASDLSDPRQLMLQAMGVNIDEINKSGLDIDDPKQFGDLIAAHMMGVGIERNPDGSFNVDLDPEKAMKMFNKVGSLFDGMLDGLSSSSPESPAEQEQDAETA